MVEDKLDCVKPGPTIRESKVVAASVPVTDENMNKSVAKASFGTRRLRRRSSLFFKNVKETTDEMLDEVNNCESTNACDGRTTADEEQNICQNKQILRGRSFCQRRRSRLPRSSLKTRTKAANQNFTFEMIFEPPPVTLKPALISAAQRAARQISMRAKGWKEQKHVHFCSSPKVRDITPRPDKIPGVVKMPDSPTGSVEKITTNYMETSESEADYVPKRSNVLETEEIVRFLPAAAKILSTEVETNVKQETVFDKSEGSNNDDGNNLEENVTATNERIELESGLNVKRDVENGTANIHESKATAMNKTKTLVKPNIIWVRGERLRSRGNWMEKSLMNPKMVSENKENMDSAVKHGSLEEEADVPCDSASTVDASSYASILALPRARPSTKVKTWLTDIPEQFSELREETGKILHSKESQQSSNASKLQRDAFDVLMGKEMSSCKSNCAEMISNEKEQKKNHSRYRRSLWFRNAIIELPSSKRRQTIISGLKCINKRDADAEDDDVIFLGDLRRKKVSMTPSFEEGKAVAEHLARTKTAAVIKCSSTSNDCVIDVERESFQKAERKPAMLTNVDFAPFPTISNVGYGETRPVNYDLPYPLRQQPLLTAIGLCSRSFFHHNVPCEQICNESNVMEQSPAVDSEYVAEVESVWRKWQKRGRISSLTEELQQCIWSEVLRPLEVDEMISVGNTVREVCQWIGAWKERLQKNRSLKKDTNSIKACRRERMSDTDSYDSFDSDEEQQLCNTIIIHGPYGSGKTSLVYVAAKQYGMRVLEFASNEKRSGVQLKCKLQGATHSHKFSMASLFKHMLVQDGMNEGKSYVEDSIILIDDCDVVYDKLDDGFWSALKALCKEALIPIVIICEDAALVRQALGHDLYVLVYPLVRLQPHIVSSYLQMLCTALNIPISPDICSAIVDHYDCDIRACINHLQFCSVKNDSDLLFMLSNHSMSEELAQIDSMSKKRRSISYNVVVRCDHSYEPESTFLSDIREESLGNVEKTEVHEAVKVTRSVVPAIEYHPLSDVVLDYIPYLCVMNRASHAKVSTKRRALHYFDELLGDTQIDPTGRMKSALLKYFFLPH